MKKTTALKAIFISLYASVQGYCESYFTIEVKYFGTHQLDTHSGLYKTLSLTVTD